MNIDIDTLAEQLIEARRVRQPLARLLPEGTTGSIQAAMRVQQEIVRRCVQQGDRVIGFKLGNIAKAMQDKFGVNQPDYGYLLDSCLRYENLRLDASEFIQPYVELEPAFVLKRDLGGAHVNVADVVGATDCVLPALEIIDSRIQNWNIGIFETLADCGSNGAVILGAQPRTLREVNLSDMAGDVRFDGEVVATGNTAAIYGNPVSALVWLCRRVAEFGITLKQGQIILPGSCLAAVLLKPGVHVCGAFAGWGDVAFEYTSSA